MLNVPVIGRSVNLCTYLHQTCSGMIILNTVERAKELGPCVGQRSNSTKAN